MSEAPRNVEKQGDKADELQKQIIEGKTGKEELAKKEVAPAKDLEDAKKAKEDQEMSDLVKLANQQAGEIRQLKGQIGTVENQIGKVGQSIAESAEDRFYNDLDKAVPDYHAINKDEKWLEWLAQVDPLTGRNRQQFLDEAREAFDVKRVANFFKAFKGVNGGVTLDQGSSEVPPDNAGSKDALGEQVMPEQTGAGEGSDLQPKVKTVTFAQYTKAVKDAQTGRITEEEFNKIANQYQRQIGKPAQ